MVESVLAIALLSVLAKELALPLSRLAKQWFLQYVQQALFIIIPRDRRELYESVRRQFAGIDRVQVILDRRLSGSAPLAQLREERRLSREIKEKEIKNLMERLAEQRLVKATPTGNDIVYTITADGVMELERTAKKGFLTRSV